jgi:hypothetical protein
MPRLEDLARVNTAETVGRMCAIHLVSVRDPEGAREDLERAIGGSKAVDAERRAGSN